MRPLGSGPLQLCSPRSQNSLPAAGSRGGQSPGGFLLPPAVSRPLQVPESWLSGDIRRHPLPGLLSSPGSPGSRQPAQLGPRVRPTCGAPAGPRRWTGRPRAGPAAASPPSHTAGTGSHCLGGPAASRSARGTRGHRTEGDGRIQGEPGCPGSRRTGSRGHAQLTGSPGRLTSSKDAIVLIRQLWAGLRSGAAALGGLAVAGGLVAGLAEPPVWARPLDRDGAAANRSPPTPTASLAGLVLQLTRGHLLGCRCPWGHGSVLSS